MGRHHRERTKDRLLADAVADALTDAVAEPHAARNADKVSVNNPDAEQDSHGEPNADALADGNPDGKPNADALGHADPHGIAVSDVGPNALVDAVADDHGEWDAEPEWLFDRQRNALGDAHAELFCDTERHAEPQCSSNAVRVGVRNTFVVGNWLRVAESKWEPLTVTQWDAHSFGDCDSKRDADSLRLAVAFTYSDKERVRIAERVVDSERGGDAFRDGVCEPLPEHDAECIGDAEPN